MPRPIAWLRPDNYTGQNNLKQLVADMQRIDDLDANLDYLKTDNGRMAVLFPVLSQNFLHTRQNILRMDTNAFPRHPKH